MKKILALVLSVVLVVSCVTVPAFSAGSSYELAEEMELLYALGIISSPTVSDTQLSTHITRGEAAKHFCRVLGLEVSDPTGFESIFYDVTSEMADYKYIKTICEAGYMQGDGDGRFRPTYPISTKETALVLSRLIGYKSYTAVMGLDATINKTDLLEDVPIVDKVEVGQFIKMIYNALHAPVCVATGISSNSMDYKIDENYLGIDYLLNVSVAKGIVDGIQGSTLTDAGFEMKENGVAIDGFVYIYPKDASALFGYEVDFYYRNDVETYDIVYMKASDKNRTMTLNYDEIIGYSDFEYSYDVNNHVKTVSIQPDTDIIYNGVAYTMPTNEIMVPKFGSVTLIDNNNDHKYDIVSIESYEFMVVDTVNTDKMIIKDRDGKTVLNLENANEVSLTYNGAVYSIDRLYTGNLLKVKQTPADCGYYKVLIEVNKDEESGAAITATGPDSLTVLGKKLSVWENIDQSSRDNMVVGNVVSVYTSNGIVVRVEKEKTGSNYAYLMSIGEPKPFSEELQFRLILSDMREVILEKGKNIKIDGVLINNAEDVESALSPGAALAAQPSNVLPLGQPVKYKMNSEGYLTEIDTLYFNADKEDPETSLHTLDNVTYRYRSTSKSMYNKDTSEFVAYATNFMKVPTTERNSVPDYRTTLPSENGTYMMDICNVDEENMKAEFVFYYRETYTRGTSSALYVILDKLVELNQEGDVVETLVVGNAGKTYNWGVTEEMKENFYDLQIGDLISIELNNNNQLRGMTRKYRMTEQPSLEERVVITTSRYNTEKTPPHTDGYRILYGTVVNIDGNNMIFTPTLHTDLTGVDPTYEIDNLIIDTATIYKYSVNRGVATMEQATADDIVSYNMDKDHPSTVVVDIQNSVVKQIFVIEN